MDNPYAGIIIEESLKDNRILNDFKIKNFKITSEEDPSQRWYMYRIAATDKDIQKASENIKTGWYAHFWRNEGEDMIVVFRDKIFKINYHDKNTWKEAVDHGLSLGIPADQLDFAIE